VRLKGAKTFPRTWVRLHKSHGGECKTFPSPAFFLNKTFDKRGKFHALTPLSKETFSTKTYIQHMVRIRLQRHGSTHSPHYRLVACEQTTRRDGRFIEILGTYSPCAKGKEVEVKVNLDRVEHWLSVGAQPSDTVRSLVKRARKSAPVAA
jgi:small subunit ribosomal protein S16